MDWRNRRQGKERKTRGSAGLLAVVLSGGGGPQATRNYMADLGNGNILGATENAIEQSDEKDGEPRDLLWALEAGTLLRHNGLFERSTKMLDGAENLMNEDDTRNMIASGANQTLAVLVNDNEIGRASCRERVCQYV